MNDCIQQTESLSRSGCDWNIRVDLYDQVSQTDAYLIKPHKRDPKRVSIQITKSNARVAVAHLWFANEKTTCEFFYDYQKRRWEECVAKLEKEPFFAFQAALISVS